MASKSSPVPNRVATDWMDIHRYLTYLWDRLTAIWQAWTCSHTRITQMIIARYSFQIYFDFSGYSDMAVGISRMFNVELSINFASPYKAVNIIDFWRRWHISLSAFLRDYLYIPLGGNRRGPIRRYLNLMITMLLGDSGTELAGDLRKNVVPS